VELETAAQAMERELCPILGRTEGDARDLSKGGKIAWKERFLKLFKICAV
jgi:hypothetical protein